MQDILVSMGIIKCSENGFSLKVAGVVQRIGANVT